MTTTPRVAESIEDLKVGMVVALLTGRGIAPIALPFMGQVQESGRVRGAFINGGEIQEFHPEPTSVTDGEWVILFERPPVPVTVSREAIDRLAASWHLWESGAANHCIGQAARALLAEVEGQET